MKIIQIISTISYGDAVSNDAKAICKVIAEMGYKTGIYAEHIGKGVSDKYTHNISDIDSLHLTDEDVVIFNHSTGTKLCYILDSIPGRKLMIYHNITPPKFFRGFSEHLEGDTEYGYRGTRHAARSIEQVMAISKYNADSLVELGYTCKITVRPILIPFNKYNTEADNSVIAKYTDDGYVNILFVGRIAPNKKHEDIVRAFAHYKKYVNPKSRLIFVGNDRGIEKYGECIRKYVNALQIDDVVFTGHISFSEVLSYYKIAHVFLCMSEHEGFGVPLVEAMYFNVPIIAYDSSAVAETLGGSGILVDNKNPVMIAAFIDRLVRDKEFKNAVVNTQRQRLKYFSYDKVRNQFCLQLKEFINNKQE